MFGSSDDVAFSCLVAAALVVFAHGIDAVGGRQERGSWSNSLASAVCALAIVVLIFRVPQSASSTDYLLLGSTAAAVVASALPLFGVVGSRASSDDDDDDVPSPRNPWDRAFRVRRNRAAELLGVPAAPAPTPPLRPVARPAAPVTEKVAIVEQARDARRVHEGVIVEPHVVPPPPAPAPAARRMPAADPEVQEAETTLNDVGEVVDGLGRLLGLDSPSRRRR